MRSSVTPDARETEKVDGPVGCPCQDCFGREVFAGANPEAPLAPAALRTTGRLTFSQFLSGHRRSVGLLLGAAAATVFVLAVLPQVTGLGDTLSRIGRGDLRWLLLGVALEALSIAAYIALFKSVFSGEGGRLGWLASYEITMAGLIATKLFAAAGAGGIALTAWALRAAGLQARAVARRIAGFEILLYSLFMIALVVAGIGLGAGVFARRAPWAISFLPAGLAILVIALALSTRLMPERTSHGSAGSADNGSASRRAVARLEAIPRGVREGMTSASEVLSHPTLGLLGAVAYWAFDIAALWASFRAFGPAPAVATVVMGYFVGQLANTFPVPGGIGAVEGGLVWCLHRTRRQRQQRGRCGTRLPGHLVLATDTPGGHRLFSAPTHNQRLARERPAASHRIWALRSGRRCSGPARSHGELVTARTSSAGGARAPDRPWCNPRRNRDARRGGTDARHGCARVRRCAQPH